LPVKASLILPTVPCSLEGVQFSCPAKLEDYLRERFTTLAPAREWNKQTKKYEPTQSGDRYKSKKDAETASSSSSTDSKAAPASSP